MFSTGDVQEVMDLAAVAHLAALECHVPFMHFFDGFRTSHELATIEPIDEDALVAMLDQDALAEFKRKALNPEHPVLRNTVQNPDVYFQIREASNRSYDAVPGVVEKYLEKISALNRQLNARNELLSKTFGQFLSDEIVSELLDTPGAAEPGGKKRTVTVMMSDLRGFTAMSERMDADILISMLNHYLAEMTDAIQGHGGTIIEFMGDGILAIFGAPVHSDTHAEDGVAAAMDMQASMERINRWNAEQGYPRLEMGIGMATGEVIVGIIGSEKRMKYGVIGSPVNQCGRIESYTTGGQVLISQSVRDAVTVPLEIEKEMTVFPKGVNKEVVLSQVTGIGAPYDIHITMQNDLPEKLDQPVPICFYRIDGKHVTETPCYGGITAAGSDCAILETDTQLELLDNLQISAGGRLLCKVMDKKDRGYLIQYTAVPSGYDQWIHAHTTGKTAGKNK
jgi:adenylate cyclase